MPNCLLTAVIKVQFVAIVSKVLRIDFCQMAKCLTRRLYFPLQDVRRNPTVRWDEGIRFKSEKSYFSPKKKGELLWNQDKEEKEEKAEKNINGQFVATHLNTLWLLLFDKWWEESTCDRRSDEWIVKAIAVCQQLLSSSLSPATILAAILNQGEQVSVVLRTRGLLHCCIHIKIHPRWYHIQCVWRQADCRACCRCKADNPMSSEKRGKQKISLVNHERNRSNDLINSSCSTFFFSSSKRRMIGSAN